MSEFEKSISTIEQKVNRNKRDFSEYGFTPVPTTNPHFDIIRKLYDDPNIDPELKEALYWVIIASASEINFLEKAMMLAVGYR